MLIDVRVSTGCQIQIERPLRVAFLLCKSLVFNGGAERDRTVDLLNAIQKRADFKVLSRRELRS